LKKICDLSLEYGDEVVLSFDLEETKSSKHSAPANFNLLQKKYGFLLFHIDNTSDLKSIQQLKKSNLDILFIIGWHRIVSQETLDTAKIVIGIHSSLLPKDRGSSPLNWALIRGDTEGGVTLFHLSSGVDSGPIIDQKQFTLSFEDNIKTAYDKATLKSLELLEENWNDIHNLQPKKIHQDEVKATINPRRKPEDGLLDWTKNSIQCYNFIRALTIPYPGAFTFLNGKKILIWESKISSMVESKPGEILETNSNLIVSTGKNSLEIITLQAEEESICDANHFCQLHNLQKGCFFKSK